MPKKKIKTRTILLKLNEEDYNKIILQAGEYKTFTQVIEENIRGGYFSKFKTNDVESIRNKQNREVVKQLQEQSVDKNQITLDEVLNEQEELERLKAERRARKSGDSND